MRIFFILSIAILTFAFKPVKEKNKDFQVISAVRQTTFGGVAGSPVSTLYKVRLKVLRPFTLIADSIFAQDQVDRFSIVKDSFTQVDTLKLKKGMTIELLVALKTATDMGGSDFQLKIPGSREVKTPVQAAGGMVIRYFGGKNKCLTIKSVEKKPDIFMP
jgi:hypothetical protein